MQECHCLARDMLLPPKHIAFPLWPFHWVCWVTPGEWAQLPAGRVLGMGLSLQRISRHAQGKAVATTLPAPKGNLALLSLWVQASLGCVWENEEWIIQLRVAALTQVRLA